MTKAVQLSKVVEVLDYPEGMTCLLDRSTMKVIVVSEDEETYLEDGELDLSDAPEWQRELVLDARRVLKSEDPLYLPTRFDVHEWDIMREFSTLQDDVLRAELLDAIHGSGAFRLFQFMIARFDLKDAWYAYRSEALKEIARDWLMANDVPFVED
jgi:hypothetical protein